MQTDAEIYDTHLDLVTPENISFHYRVAGPFRRLPAYLLDIAVRVLIFVSAGFLLQFTFVFLGFNAVFIIGPAMVILWFLMDWFYGGLFEALWNGQTPGKRLLQIRVVSEDGQPITGLQAILRNFLKLADAMPYFPLMYLIEGGNGWWLLCIVGFVVAASNKRFQRIGDLFAHTVVVVEESRRLYGVNRITDPAALRLAQELPVNFQVSRTLSRALSDYVMRRERLGKHRRQEVAKHLAIPLQIRLNLPRDTNSDTLLCALYHRVFLSDREEPEFDLSNLNANPRESISLDAASFR